MKQLHLNTRGFTLLEVLIVLVIISTAAAIIIPNSRGNRDEHLRAAARVVAAELDYARSLAVTFNSTYRATFDSSLHRLVLEHTGADLALDRLPKSPHRASSDPSTQQILLLSSLSGVNETVTLHGATAGAQAVLQTVVSDVEFDSLGETTRSDVTTLWLTAGSGDAKRYLAIEIDPVTGSARVQNPTGTSP